MFPILRKRDITVTGEQTISLKNVTAYAIANYGSSEVVFGGHRLDAATSDNTDKQTSFSVPYCGGMFAPNEELRIYFEAVNPTDTPTHKAVITIVEVIGFTNFSEIETP